MATQAAGTMTAAHEWRAYGLLVFAGMIGMSLNSVPSTTLGLFMEPLSREFGWNRTEISLGMTIFTIVAMPLGPLAGVLVDRFGARRVAIPGTALTAACFAAFSLITGSLVQWILIWVAFAFVALAIRTLVWSSAISAAFEKSRGLALAVMLCGIAIATSLAPTVARLLIDQWGWRGGYLGLGLGWGGLSLAMVVLFFREARTLPLASPDQPARTPAELPGGLSFGEAMRSFTVQRIAFAIFLQSLLFSAIVVHIVPMLTEDGLSPAQATGIAGLFGISSLFGKLISGWMADRFSAKVLPALCFGLPGFAFLVMLRASDSLLWLSSAVAVLGYCGGATIQLCTYLTTRYVGLRKFGTIFGVISSVMALASGLGPLLGGRIFDVTGNYDLLLAIGCPAALLSGVAVFRLGPYPVFSAVPAEPRLTPSSAAAN